MKINDLIKEFKLDCTIDEYKKNIGDNVHYKQINFCTKLCDEFMNNDENNITVNTNRCGIGKSTTIKAFLNNLVNNYSYFGKSHDREWELDHYGAIVIHDSLEGLEKIANYKGLTDRCYFMRFDKEDIESRSNARVDFKMQLQEQFKYPIVLITTQKYFKMNDEERKMLYKWKNGSRSIKIIDEKPYILATTTIDEVYLSGINIALEEIVKGEDKNYIITCWKKIRNDLDFLRDSYANKYEIMWITKEDRALLSNKREDKNFFNILGQYVTTDTYDKIADIRKIYSDGCLFISSGDKEQDNKRQFVLLHNNIDKLDMDKCKCFILDATSKFDIDYTISENFKFLHVDDKKEVNDINIHHVQTSTSQKTLLSSNKIDTISKFINEKLGDECFVATYGKKKGIYQKFYKSLKTNQVAYFGDIKGKNTWESYNNMAHVGLNRKSNSVYLQKYILLKDKANEWNKMKEEDIAKQIEDILQVSQENKGWYNNGYMNEIMMRDMVVDTVQNIMRIKCRHFSNKEMCNIFIICAKNYANVVSRINDVVGGKIFSYVPDIFLAETTDNRKPVNGKEKTNPQIIKEYLEGLDKGEIVKIKDIIDGSGLSRKQIDKVREKNQWCKTWFENHKGNKSGQYIV